MTSTKSKYGNKKVTFAGITFHSKDECEYYMYLLHLQTKKIVKTIVLQPKVVLIESFERNGKKYRATTYTLDFLVTYYNNKQEYIDVKGFSTQQGDLRRKLFESKYDVPLKWIAKSKKYSDTGWIDYDTLQKLRRENKRVVG